MTVEVAELSVGKLRQVYLADGAPVPKIILLQMLNDRRKEVRRMARRLDLAQAKKASEYNRLEKMLRLERSLWRSGKCYVAGVDEAGIGPLAGPVVAAAVVFPAGIRISGIDDSKRLDPVHRMDLARTIQERALSVGIGVAQVEEIDHLNVYHAGLLAMQRAVTGLTVKPQHLLLDARMIPNLSIIQQGIRKGDQISFSIAAASIIAKTHRDQLMTDLDVQYPKYGFARHKGYGTLQHMRAIKRYGLVPIHRRSFPVLQELLGAFSSLFYSLNGQLNEVDSISGLNRFRARFETALADLDRRERSKLRLKLRNKSKTLHLPPRHQLCDSSKARTERSFG